MNEIDPDQPALVARLRDHENEGVTSSDRFHLRNEAADRIEALEAALRDMVRLYDDDWPTGWERVVRDARRLLLSPPEAK
jgi:hypothetical protein